MIKLVNMTEDEFQSFIDLSVADYAGEKVRKGSWSAEEAMAKAENVFLALLPYGLDTADHYLFTIQDTLSQSRVGSLWLAFSDEGRRSTAFIYDIRIDPEHRRRGFATGTFQALEQVAAARGASSIRLHVFGHNHGARALYEKLGFITTSIEMSKPVGPTSV